MIQSHTQDHEDLEEQLEELDELDNELELGSSNLELGYYESLAFLWRQLSCFQMICPLSGQREGVPALIYGSKVGSGGITDIRNRHTTDSRKLGGYDVLGGP